MSGSTILVLCTCDAPATANLIANTLVEQGLAACVNVLAPVKSVYRWQGRTETSEEVLLLIKTSRNRYADLEASIQDLHPYELPEIIAVPVEQGLSAYLDWVDQCTDATR